MHFKSFELVMVTFKSFEENPTPIIRAKKEPYLDCVLPGSNKGYLLFP